MDKLQGVKESIRFEYLPHKGRRENALLLFVFVIETVLEIQIGLPLQPCFSSTGISRYYKYSLNRIRWSKCHTNQFGSVL